MMRSLASMELALKGITGQQLADDLGVTRAAVSFQLSGRAATTSEKLLDAIRERGGEVLAARVKVMIAVDRGDRRIVGTASEIMDMLQGRGHDEP